ncbi:deoxyribonuclease gamma-like [Spea bombifrons]|uniref:deoxyribonuclease gamma-like n=1 Tax=Spea bombifrons TaxID=233779 RepID=UPI00234A03B9|nr:deoxyribonuclease gamma-like [Spea bombifrons]
MPCRAVALLLLSAHLAAAAFKICAFNVKSFGEAKVSNKRVLESLVKILARCDICVIQEVRDAKGEAIPTLVKELNRYAGHHLYAHLNSRRLGRNSYKEQLVFLYRSDTVEVTDWHQYEEHPESFAREPLAVRFHSPRTVMKDFVVMSHHTCPREAAKEINALLELMLDVERRWKVESVMLLGDLNASCGYVTVEEWKGILRRSSDTFHWLIGDQEDTTVSHKTHCAYDRIVIHGERFLKAIVQGSAKPFNFAKKLGLSEEEALRVSDHFPVEVNLRIHPRVDREL